MSFENRVLEFRNLYDEISRRMPLIEGKVFKEQYVYPDFNRYDKCEFIKCTFVFDLGICSFTNCGFDGCKFEAKQGSPASFILELDRQIRESAFRETHR